MPSEKNNILEFNQDMKSDKMIQKNQTIFVHIPCGYLMLSIWLFDHIENKKTLYRGKDCMKKLCESLKEHVNFVKKEKGYC